MFELYELTEFWSEGILTSMARNSISTVAPEGPRSRCL